jgi:hypothetical protein
LELCKELDLMACIYIHFGDLAKGALRLVNTKANLSNNHH